MNPLLFLCHRIPYPPNKGDKIRSFNVLKELAGAFAVHLGAFVDLREDWQHADALRSMVAGLHLSPLPRRAALLRSAYGLLSGEPLSLPYYRDQALSRWVGQAIREHRIERALVFSSAMGQYLPREKLAVEVVDFCDVDSEKWRQYARTRRAPLSMIYAREARLLADYECRLALRSDRSLFVSDSEGRLFTQGCPRAAAKVLTVRNGVDTEYFRPGQRQPGIGADAADVVFTGAMDYWANVEAILWFARSIWPEIRARAPGVRLDIVGSRPAASVRALDGRAGIRVTGSVPDVRPFLAAARAVVAPLRIARGIQNKVLEALAMARPVVATPAAMAGLDASVVPGVQVAEDPRQFAQAVGRLLHPALPANNEEGRRFVVQRFGWPASLSVLRELLTAGATTSSNGASRQFVS